ncbi:hypothetical protein BGX38DRAFT_318127 [Terfezia claveryi]|nr:hypothetical protein BGX38DRAFT_318127 [Terfezia claveryi]
MSKMLPSSPASLSTPIAEMGVKSTNNITQDLENGSNASVMPLQETQSISTGNTENMGKEPSDAALEINTKSVSAQDAPAASTQSKMVPADDNMSTRSLSMRCLATKLPSSGEPNSRSNSMLRRQPTTCSKKASTELLDLTKPPKLPPLDLGANITEPGLEGTVKRMEIQLRGLELQFEKFRRAHVKLIHDHKELLEAHCQELGGSTAKKRDKSVRRKENERTPMKNSGNDELETLESDKEMASGRREGSPSCRLWRINTTHRRGRSPTRTRMFRHSSPTPSSCDVQLQRASSESGRGASQTRSLPVHSSHSDSDIQPQRGSSGHISLQREASRRASSISCPPRSHTRVRSSEQPHSRLRPFNNRTVPDVQPRPRPLSRRVTSLTLSKPQEILSVGLGADFDAFPRWSKLGLDTMDTFKTAQGPSAVRKWKSGKLSKIVA